MEWGLPLESKVRHYHRIPRRLRPDGEGGFFIDYQWVSDEYSENDWSLQMLDPNIQRGMLAALNKRNKGGGETVEAKGGEDVQELQEKLERIRGKKHGS